MYESRRSAAVFETSAIVVSSFMVSYTQFASSSDRRRRIVESSQKSLLPAVGTQFVGRVLFGYPMLIRVCARQYLQSCESHR